MDKTLKQFIFISLSLISSQLFAQPITWNISDGGNGHSYEAILSTGSWQSAKLAAENAGGYLATITSAAENQFIYDLVKNDTRFWYQDPYSNGVGPWLGGYQSGGPEPHGGWNWVTGEDFTYTNWETGEPNNFQNASEDYLHFLNRGALIGSTWNDMPNGVGVRGYIIEYEASEVSIPTNLSLLLLGLGLLVKVRRRRP